MSRLIVLDGGMLSSLQDRGRAGYQQYGVPVAGSMDFQAMETANLLVGNGADEAVIEMTVNGGSYLAQGDLVVAVFGANMPMTVDGRPVRAGRAFLLKDGSELSIGNAKAGLRAYMAVRGGFNIKEVMGSKSTYLQGKIGGFEGRKLQKDDLLCLAEEGFEPGDLFSLPQDYMDKYYEDLAKNSKEAEIRVVEGPQEEAFTEEGLRTFYNSTYTISNNSNRMGYRLDGEKIEHVKGADIISDGIMFGSIQVPGDGLPLIMMADHQTTGGYTKIACVITPDLPKLAQLGPGARIRFKRVDYDMGLETYRSWRKKIDNIKEIFEVDDLKKDQEDLKRDGDMDMNLKDIEKLIQAFDSLNLSKLDIKDGDFMLSLERGVSGEVTNPVKAGPLKQKTYDAKQDIDDNPSPFESDTDRERPDLYEVKAPISGMCYRAPGEAEPPFVEKGTRVKKGQTLMILEVMKMMNEITAPVDGVIEEILFENEQKVEAGDLLFTLRQ